MFPFFLDYNNQGLTPNFFDPKFFAHARAVIAYTAIRNLGYKGTEVAEVLSLSPPTVSQNVEKGKLFLDRNENLKVKLKIN